jgi:tetratricopeptide (TPR) repeat protein
MFFVRKGLLILALAAPVPCLAQKFDPLAASPLAPTADHLRLYTDCMALARKEPLKALPMAEKWKAEGGGLGARHCVAIAMFEAGKPVQAATQLEAIARDMGQERPGLRAELWAQAGQAWLLSGDPVRAYAADGAALTLRPDDADLLVDRSEAAGMAGWFDKAVADLDRVLRNQPQRVDALIYRASANRELNQLDPAQADIDKALSLAPDSVAALLERGNIRRLRGDMDGARGDWVRVSMLAPGSAADHAAKSNIERLDLKDDPAAPANKAGRCVCF